MTSAATSAVARLVPMRPRDPGERGRVASTLELFFDLVFVVAVSIASEELATQLEHGHAATAIPAYLMVFFAIWWAWMNFTWFGTSYATDDWLYRVVTIVQMAGVLVLAAGIGAVFEHHDLTLTVVGYVIMRVAMVFQWLRAAYSDPAHRRTTIAYAVGIAIMQVLWVLLLVLPTAAQFAVTPTLILGELAVPVVAEQFQRTTWHAHHITERYGLFTLIVLGETLLASANAVITALRERESGEHTLALVGLGALTLVTAASLWWVYFWPHHHRAISSFRSSLMFGYGHYFVFAAAAAFSAGVEVHIASVAGHSELSGVPAAFALALPIAVFLLALWAVSLRLSADPVVTAAVPVAAVLVLLAALLPAPLIPTAVVLIALVVLLVVRGPVDQERAPLAPHRRASQGADPRGGDPLGADPHGAA